MYFREERLMVNVEKGGDKTIRQNGIAKKYVHMNIVN